MKIAVVLRLRQLRNTTLGDFPMNKPEKYKLFVDGDKYEWDENTITGVQLRELAGIPDNVQIFQAVPGQPDIEISDETVIDLKAHHGPVKLSTQSPGSQAG